MAEAELTLLLSMQDEASAQLESVQKTVKSSATSIAEYHTALRMLGSGFMYLGTTILSAGVALSTSNNETEKAIGQTLTMAGATLAAVGSAIELVSAISKIVAALQAWATWQLIINLLTNPIVWIAIIAGVGLGALAYEKYAQKAQDATDKTTGLDKATKDLNSTLSTTEKIVNGFDFKWTGSGWMPVGSTATSRMDTGGYSHTSDVPSIYDYSGIGTGTMPGYNVHSAEQPVVNVTVQGSVLSESDLKTIIREMFMNITRQQGQPAGATRAF